MKADDLKIIAEKALVKQENKWWEEYKEKLFKKLKEEAEKGNCRLTIYIDSDLNHSGLLDSSRLRNRLEKELSVLGYIVNYHSGSYMEDGYDKSITIGWM